jgi:phosphohistidine phosphatase
LRVDPARAAGVPVKIGRMPLRRQLHLLRHAKSSWDEPGLDDHDRPLAPRGRRAAELIGAYLRAEQIEPQLVLCSSSRRTRETLEAVDPAGEVLIEPALYEASAATILERVRELPDTVTTAMVIGHQPAMQVLTLRLARAQASAAPESSLLAEVQRKFPTGALATLEFAGNWGELSAGSAVLAAFVRPKGLARRSECVPGE